MKSIPYGRHDINAEDISAVVNVLQSEFLTQGPKVSEFEKKFADYVGARFAVAVNNGTAALHLAVLALGLKPNQKVITTPISFVATANCILYAGAQVQFVDIDMETGTLDIRQLRELLMAAPSGTYSGVIPVDFAGYPVNTEVLKELAKEHNFWILEDACHAPGGYFTDKAGRLQLCGNCAFSDASIFSFHPVKHIATGEGGMITTNSKSIYDSLLLLRTHGITKEPSSFQNANSEISQGGWYYEMQTLGFNYRMPDILAALGASQLSRAPAGVLRRRKIAEKYDAAFASRSPKIKILHMSGKPPGHAYHLYIILTDNRDSLYAQLRESNIFAQVHYIPIHLQPYYQKLGFKKHQFPAAENFYNTALSLPMYASLSDSDVDFVIECVLSSCES